MGRISGWQWFKAGCVAIGAVIAAIFYALTRRAGEAVGAAKERAKADTERVREAEKEGDTAFLREDILRRTK